tara:strand:+ start:816 stop:1472 length:657 start_codon:yes stop_codon:yes gene_type:complete
MNFEKYKNDGWGLSKQQFKQLKDIISSSKKDELRVAEFGSGKSTEFFVDITLEDIKKIDIVSFDDNPHYAYKNEGNHHFLNLVIRQLLECTDASYEKMFKEKQLDRTLLYTKKTPLSSRQKNNFYEVKDGDLNGIYDIMVLDGPNGNGRNISFLHMVNHLDIESIVLIDDYTHYDFVEKFSLFFNFEVLHEANNGGVNQWETGGIYKILKITSKNEKL